MNKKPHPLLQAMQEYESYMVEVRRTIHKYPELGLEEIRTADYICSLLDQMNIEYSRHKTAVTALIRGSSESPCVALRADIDALAIQEESEEPFASEQKGKMHACGHDAHTAMLLGAARWFSEHRSELTGSVKLLFQPAEETVGGAEPMIKDGALEKPFVDRIFGLHVMPYLPVGMVEYKEGSLNGSSTNLDILIKGKSGHGAYPESGVDAVLVASQVITGSHTLVSRQVSPLDQAVISFGTIEGGSAPNVIAQEVRIKGTMRSCNEELRDSLISKLTAMVNMTCAAYGASAEINTSHGYTALINDPIESKRVKDVAINLLGEDSVIRKANPSMGVEDFAFFLKERKGAFYHLGCGLSANDAPLHSSRFKLNEQCLTIGAAMHVALTMEIFNKKEDI